MAWGGRKHPFAKLAPVAGRGARLLTVVLGGAALVCLLSLAGPRTGWGAAPGRALPVVGEPAQAVSALRLLERGKMLRQGLADAKRRSFALQNNDKRTLENKEQRDVADIKNRLSKQGDSVFLAWMAR